MPKLFGTDGIRGFVGKWPLQPDFFLDLGYSAGSIINSESGCASVIVGRDTRSSGQMLQNALMSGLLASGVDVIDVGEIPTSGIAMLLPRLKANAGVVISASHNPIEWNAFKLINSNILSL